MFSGFRYIFGYNEETALPAANDATATSMPTENNDVTASLSTSAETSTNKLEQTLNAATTKFTEQLLPQQASIEELQSSSHQLLPSIIEQHEEDDLKKKRTTCEIIDSVDVDDEDGFNAESWELLDLVEKTEDEVAPVSLASSVQGGEVLSKGLCKSTSGILKSQNTHDNKENDSSQKRQKPKVSFEAAKLVKSKQEIEKTKSNATEASGSKEEIVESSKLVGSVDCKQVPILNYAKALSKRLITDTSESTAEPSSGSSGSALKAGVSLGPVKRVRPAHASSSSWSSHDEEDSSEQLDNVDWEVSYGAPEEGQVLNVQVNNADDNESLISSGFSDCDYGFGGINDYVVRPKRANVKRGRTISTSSDSTIRTKSSRSKSTNAKAKLTSAMDAKCESKSAEAKELKSEAHRSAKPKKKRMMMSTSKSVNLSDFLKFRPSGSKELTKQGTSKMVSEGSQQLCLKPGGGGGSGSTESSDIAEMDESWFVTPPPCFTKAAKLDSLEKIESPETKEDDQENALIEHPSVYIASVESMSPSKAKKGVTAKLRSAGISKARCTSSKLDSSGKNLMTLEDESWNSGDDESNVKLTEDQRTPTVVKVDARGGLSGNEEMTIIASAVSETEPSTDMNVLITAAGSKVKITKKAPKSSKKVVKSSTVISKPSENKAWKNKFIVDVWDLDDNDDVDSDFDSMFESTRKRKSAKPKKQQPKQVKEAAKNVKPEKSELASFDYPFSGSVELLSVKSLVSLEFDDLENTHPSVDSIVNEKPVVCEKLEKDTSSVQKCNAEHRRPPIQVRPLEPERVPSWKLKRQRSKRRPLAAVTVVNRQQACPASGSPKTLKANGEPSASASSSSRSSPTLIDRIGCSIVANLTNLTNGLVSSGAMNYCSSNVQGPMVESQPGRAVANKASFNNSGALAARKQLSRGNIRRQNICAKQANTLRRPDRRLKLFATPNGSSINRKVHTSIH